MNRTRKPNNPATPLGRISTGLVACWGMFEGGGATTRELIARKDGTLNGTQTAWGTDLTGRAVTFDGSASTRVTTGAHTRIGALTKVTFDCMLYMTAQPAGLYPRVINVNSSGTDFIVATTGASGVAPENIKCVYVAAGATTPRMTAASTILTNIWYHLAASWDGSAWAVYIDGQNMTLANASAANYGDANQCTLGARLTSGISGAQMTSRLGFVRVWNRVLPYAAIAEIARDPYAMFRQPAKRMLQN